jgi:hypothetical protein
LKRKLFLSDEQDHVSGSGAVSDYSDAAPGTQAWIYRFYYAFEKIMSGSQRSILDAVLRGLGDPYDNLDVSEASPRQKEAAKKIIRSFVRRYPKQ